MSDDDRSGDRPAPHSALYFGATRDFWWYDASVAAFLARVGVRARTVLGLGSGQGHWGRLVARALGQPIDLVGVDNEPRWVAAGEALARGLACFASARYQLGDLTQRLAFPDASFDLVTCQTVLIHLADPRALVAEMARVVKPGGHLLIAEPTNFGTNAARALDPDASIDDVLRELRFYLTCERGKKALGLGDNSIAEQVPGFFDPKLFGPVHVANDDRCDALVAPYATPSAHASTQEQIAHAERGIYVFPEAEARRYFEAGGGVDFDAEYAWGLRVVRARAAAMRAGTYVSAGGCLHYLFAARRLAH